MTEEALYDAWSRRAMPGVRFADRNGVPVVVVSPGRRNTSAGPDFTDAVLLIDGELRVGAVEMHLRERDWLAHGHHHDICYESVVLHVLAVLERPSLLEIPTISLDVLTAYPQSDAVVGPAAANTPKILVELSWERLLRRATLALRRSDNSNNRTARMGVLLPMVFDVLGYSANREPMRALAAGLRNAVGAHHADTFHRHASLVLGLSGIDVNAFIASGRGFVCNSRLAEIARDAGAVARSCGTQPHRWRGDTRPSNAPHRRLWAAARFSHELLNGALAERALDSITETGSLAYCVDLCITRLGSDVFVGIERAREIAINAIAPFALAEALAAGDARRIEGVCRAYRSAPALASNAVVRRAEEYFGVPISTMGGFWHQGAMEFQQRYRNADRSGISFASEPRARWLHARREQLISTTSYRRYFNG